MVTDALPLTLTAAWVVPGVGATRLARGSAAALPPVTAWVLNEALPDFTTPPTARIPDAVRTALPPDRLTEPRSIPVVTSTKSTLPAGVPALPETVAVRVTAWPKATELGVAATVVVVAVLMMVSVTVPVALL